MFRNVSRRDQTESESVPRGVFSERGGHRYVITHTFLAKHTIH